MYSAGDPSQCPIVVNVPGTGLALIFDVSDEALEIAASAPSGQVNFTLANCTGLSACPA